MSRMTSRVILIAALAVVPLVGTAVNASAATSGATLQAGAPQAVSAASTLSSAAQPALLPIPLQQGDSGPAVKLWQEDLNAFIHFPPPSCRPTLAVDGSFGPLTTAATKCFQSAANLRRWGVVDGPTRGAMCNFLFNIGSASLFRQTCQ